MKTGGYFLMSCSLPTHGIMIQMKTMNYRNRSFLQNPLRVKISLIYLTVGLPHILWHSNKLALIEMATIRKYCDLQLNTSNRAKKCLFDCNWNQIAPWTVMPLLCSEWLEELGYIVQEAIAAVHDAMKKHEVTFAWVKFVLCWSHCGPGFCAGINISKKGSACMCCASTR